MEVKKGKEGKFQVEGSDQQYQVKYQQKVESGSDEIHKLNLTVERDYYSSFRHIPTGCNGLTVPTTVR